MDLVSVKAIILNEACSIQEYDIPKGKLGALREGIKTLKS